MHPSLYRFPIIIYVYMSQLRTQRMALFVLVQLVQKGTVVRCKLYQLEVKDHTPMYAWNLKLIDAYFKLQAIAGISIGVLIAVFLLVAIVLIVVIVVVSEVETYKHI